MAMKTYTLTDRQRTFLEVTIPHALYERYNSREQTHIRLDDSLHILYRGWLKEISRRGIYDEAEKTELLKIREEFVNWKYSGGTYGVHQREGSRFKDSWI